MTADPHARATLTRVADLRKKFAARRQTRSERRKVHYRNNRGQALATGVLYKESHRDRIRSRAQGKRAARDDSFFHALGDVDAIRRAVSHRARE